jgi:hypothetical protein
MGMDRSWTQRQAMRFCVSLSDAHSRKVIGIQLIEKQCRFLHGIYLPRSKGGAPETRLKRHDRDAKARRLIAQKWESQSFWTEITL